MFFRAPPSSALWSDNSDLGFRLLIVVKLPLKLSDLLLHLKELQLGFFRSPPVRSPSKGLVKRVPIAPTIAVTAVVYGRKGSGGPGTLRASRRLSYSSCFTLICSIVL